MAARRRLAARRNWPANLYQNSDGYFWFRNPEDSRTVGLGKDYQSAAARVRLANLKLAQRKADADILTYQESQGKTLREHCDDYEKERAVGKANTVRGTKSQLNAIRDSALASRPIAKITPKDAADLIKAAVEERGAAMAGKIRSRLRDVMRDAILHGLIERNPVDAVLKPKAQVKRARLTIEEFWDIYEKADRYLQNAMLLALLTGQRSSDVCAMRFDDTKDGFLWVEQAKTGTKIKIPLSVGVQGYTLASVIEQCRDNILSRFLVHFTHQTGRGQAGGQANQPVLAMAFKRARKSIAFAKDKTPPTFHEIRSLSARLYAEERGPEFAQAILGHKSANMTALYRDVRGREWIEVKAG